MVVVLPAPLGPRKPTTSPCLISNQMLSTALKSGVLAPKRLLLPLKILVRFRTESMEDLPENT